MYSIETARGAEWLKWDCHIHTPYSYTNEFEKFHPGNKEDEKRVLDLYVEELKKSAIRHQTDVVIINDYFTLDGYSYITKNYCQQDNITQGYYLDLETERRLYILPGVELRIDTITDNGQAINLHVFFNQKLTVKQIEEGFLHKLKIDKNGMPIELNKENLIRLGISLENHEEYKANLDIRNLSESDKKRFLNKAYDSVAINHKEIFDTKMLLEKQFKNDEELGNNCSVIVIPLKGHGSIDGIDIGEQWTGRRNNVKLDLMGMADIFYASNIKDIRFVRGEIMGEVKTKKMFGNIKSSIWGSDAHEYQTMCHPSRGDNLRYTWIKGIPSFDGLKQILLEPYDRVYIGENSPQAKMEYKVIDSIQFIADGEFYPSHIIPLNEGLNTIIGGKSSGKSLLLNCIASTVNGRSLFEYSSLKSKCDFDFQVNWKNGDVDKFSVVEDKRRKVKYVSQMYAAEFVENTEKLDKEVFDILMEDNEISDIYNTFKQNKERIDNNLNKVVFDLQQYIGKQKEYMDSAKTIGEMDSLDGELKKLIEHKEKIIQESQMTEKELEEYRTLLKSQEDSNLRQEKIKNTYVQYLESHMNYMESIVKPIKEYLEKAMDIEDDELDTYKETYEVYRGIVDVVESGVEKLRSKYLSHTKNIEDIDRHKDEIKHKLEPYEAKMKQRETLDKVNEDIGKIEKLKGDLRILITKIQQVQENINQSIATFVSSLSERIEVYKTFIEEFTELDALNMDENTRIVCVYKLDKQELLRRMSDILNNTASDNKNLLRSIEDDNFITESEVGNLEYIVGRILGGYHGCKGKYDYFDLLRYIMKDYYIFKFDIIENETSFFDMSPGKKGLIILKLILHMSNETYPILLDQPEDNLDNRTISTELQKFIKDKKISRQIVMVTHNANLAVLTDSEEIIVANQRGANKIEQQSVFDYVTGPIELSFIDKEEENVLHKKGIKEHVCDILEGGTNAFKERESKYEIDRMIARERMSIME